MWQYQQLLNNIIDYGKEKPAARPGMPGTISLFGYQMRMNLADGFPLLTTKKMFWKGVIVELLWFLRGETNIKYLIENGVNIWNGDAYNYYLHLCEKSGATDPLPLDGETGFLEHVRKGYKAGTKCLQDIEYTYGDCGYQYGKVWRDWELMEKKGDTYDNFVDYTHVDQIKAVIHSLKSNPESRRHIVTAIDPVHDKDLALYWCHAMFQFNCRLLTVDQRYDLFMANNYYPHFEDHTRIHEEQYQMRHFDNCGIPRYYLDLQLYQRSADAVLGVPFNIASYALLTHIIAELVNMVPGEFIHTFGDVHIYENHYDAVGEILLREPKELPKLRMSTEFWNPGKVIYNSIKDLASKELTKFFSSFRIEDFELEGYDPHPSIRAELSVGH